MINLQNAKVSQFGKNLIKEYEGLELNAYLDSANVWTIGYGNTFYPNGVKVKQGDKITKEQADFLFPLILKKFENGVKKLVTSNINQNQFDSLVSLAYNIGLGAFARSSVLSKVNKNPSDATIKNSFAAWNKAGGKVLKGLVRRRLAEYNHYTAKNANSFKATGLRPLIIFGFLVLTYYFYKN
jgi:lysozyme